MKKSKILKIVLIVILTIIVVFLMHTTRNYIIISKLQNEIQDKSKLANNVYRKMQRMINNKERNDIWIIQKGW